MKHRTPTLAAYALGNPITPIGVRRNGRLIFPIAGGAEPSDPADPGGNDPEPPKNEAGGFTPPASQEEFNRIIGERVARERAKFADYDDLKAKAEEFDRAAEAARTEQEKAVEAARTEGKNEVLATANARLVNAEARALAADAKFRNPTLAVRAIDLSTVKVGDDGAVDADAIKEQLKSLAEAEPYLINDGKQRPKPDGSQGGGEGKPTTSVDAGRALFAERNKTSA